MNIPELHPPFAPQEAVVEANRCLYCFDAPCTAACPTHIDVPRFIKKISTANLHGSANAILDSNILGLSCSRVCPVDVLCEGSCVMHRYNKQPIEIGRLQRHAMENFYDVMESGDWKGLSTPIQHTQKIACIGAGPASLACAAELRKLGYAVTLFEARQRPGGLNTYGVAEYKFTPGDAAREIAFISALGVEIRTGVTVGTDITFDQLESDFDAIFLGVGLGPTQKLGIPGEDLPGVIDAVRFIAAYKTEARYEVGARTIVVGGGNTAIDAAVAARILGADESIMAYRRGESEMPAFDFEYDHAKAFGVKFQWNVAPVRIIGEGKVKGVEFACTESSGDGSAPHVFEGANFSIGCDMVIVALGQSKLGAMLGDRLQISGGRIVANPATGETSNPKYFAAGDCASGGREVVDAVAEGKRAAKGIVSHCERTTDDGQRKTDN
jgi:dihydropyrimidine dehydrogenase (NAD+) subunit PreT